LNFTSIVLLDWSPDEASECTSTWRCAICGKFPDSRPMWKKSEKISRSGQTAGFG